MIDPKSRMDIETLTEIWDSGSTSISAIGPQVYNLLNELLMSSKHVTLEKTEIVKTRSFDVCHEWDLTGVKARKDILDIARSVAKEEIIKKSEAINVEAQFERDDFFWAQAITKSGLSSYELKVTLLFTTPFVNDTEPLEIKDIAQALKTEEKTVREAIAKSEEKLRKHLFQQIFTRARGGK